MNNRTIKLGRAMILSLLFTLSVFTLPLGRRGVPSIYNTIHIWSGFLLLFGAAVHLIKNRHWVKTVLFSRKAGTIKRRLRRLRRTNLGLLISGGLCATAGILWLMPGLSSKLLARSASLHRLAGIIMIALMVIHMALHWGWLVKSFQQLAGKRKTVLGVGDEAITHSE